MTQQSRARSRSVLMFAIVVGIGIGALGAWLRPAPEPETNQRTVVIRRDQGVLKLDIAQIQEALLERLIAQSAETEKPEQLPDFADFLRVFKRDSTRRAALLDRLSSKDVAPGLRLAFARHLPSRPAEQRRNAYRRLVLPLLSDKDATVQLAAAQALMVARQLETHRSPACRCRFGHYPSGDGDTRGRLLAWTLEDEGRLLWSPVALDADPSGWDLRLERSGKQREGSKVLSLSLDTAPRAGHVIVENGASSPHLLVKGAN